MRFVERCESINSSEILFMKYLPKLFLAICMSICTISLHAQTAISATGGNASGTSGTVSYTIGQVVYTTLSGTSGTITQGVQQPFEIMVMTALEEFKDIKLSSSVFPNPTTDNLTLKIGDYEIRNMSYWLIGINGNLIETKEILDAETQISMEHQVTGTYFLKVTSDGKELITYKIIKN